MKILLKLTGLCTLIAGLAISCKEAPQGEGPHTGDPDPLVSPINLTHAYLTPTSATLSWDAVEGADSYNVMIDDGDPVAVAGNSYNATGLTPETEYIWTVQALDSETESEWSADAKFTTPASDLEVPGGLDVVDLTRNSVTLVWEAVERATGYEVMIDDGEPVAVTGTEYPLTGLTPDTEYFWTVRAIEGDRSSRWAREETFTTDAIPVLEVAFTHATGEDNGTAVSADTNNFLLNFYSYDPESTGFSGFHIPIDAVSVKVDRDPFLQYLTVPNGTYAFNTNRAANTVAPSTLKQYENGANTDSWEITEGSLSVQGTSSAYTIVVEVFYGEDIFRGTYTGPLTIQNSNYDEKIVDMGAQQIAGSIEYKPGAYGNGAVDAFILEGIGDGVTIVNGELRGTGWSAGFVQFHTQAGSSSTLPAGTYSITGDNAPGTVRSGFRNMQNGNNEGLHARKVTNNSVSYTALEWGTVTVSYEGGVCTISIDGNAPWGGGRYFTTITGPAQ